MANPVLAIRVPEDVYDRIKQRAAQQNTDVSGLLRPLLAEEFSAEVERGAVPGLFAAQRAKGSPGPSLRGS